jgi:hypothetical protein
MTGGGMGIWTLFGMIFWIILISGIALLAVWAVQKAAGGETSKMGLFAHPPKSGSMTRKNDHL